MPPDIDQLLADVLEELQKLQHPAFEASLLDGLRRAINKQEATSGELISSLRQLRHDLAWLRKHIGELHLQLARLFGNPDPVPTDDETKG